MKILFTGGGSGGHFYPIIAMAEALTSLAKRERLIAPELFFAAPSAYDEGMLFENGIVYLAIPSGKLRRYASFENLTDIFKTAWGVMKALFLIFRIYPDVVVGKGGFGSFPALFAARFWGIPVLVHESDTVPGRANRFAGRFAKRIAVSFPQAAVSFPEGRVAHTGNPMRSALTAPKDPPDPGILGLSSDVPVVFVIGGSLGSKTINEIILQMLPKILEKYQVVHQTGREHLGDMRSRSQVMLQHHTFRERYHPFGYLTTEEVSTAGRLSDLVISRAGSTIFEIALWGKPSILIPITDSNGNHQRENAYAYAESGAAEVVEEANLSIAILDDIVGKILGEKERWSKMAEQAKHFAKADAAEVIAREIIEMALQHEK